MTSLKRLENSPGVTGSSSELSAPLASVRICIALFCALVSFLVTNGSIYPAIEISNPWFRETATLFGIVLLIAVICLVRYRPRWIYPKLLTGMALGCVLGYFLFCSFGFLFDNAVALLVGFLLDSAAESWLFILAYTAFAQLDPDRRPMVAIVACLITYLVQPFTPSIAPTYGVGLNACCFVILYVCVRPYVQKPLTEIRNSEPQAEMAVVDPQSFLRSSHLLYVAVLVFSIAQGLAVSLPGPFNDAPALPLSFIPLAVIFFIYLLRKKMPSADGFFSLCALLIIAGMFVQPTDRVISGGFSVSNTLIDAGASCFSLLIVLLVGGIAGRNRLTAIPTAALMLCLYWSGVFVGAFLGNSAMMFFGWSELGLVWTSFVSAMVFITFCFVVLKNVNFTEAIGAIRSPEAPVAQAMPEPIGIKACEKVAAEYGLTPRETEVLNLLAMGRTVGVIREKLVISLNTARFHTKNIYAKLGVHSQQELIDLVEKEASL